MEVLEETELLDWSEEGDGGGGAASLEVVGVMHALQSGQNRVGRDPSCQVVINHPSLRLALASFDAVQCCHFTINVVHTLPLQPAALCGVGGGGRGDGGGQRQQ